MQTAEKLPLLMIIRRTFKEKVAKLERIAEVASQYKDTY
jgi:hypothetical protein